MNKNMFYIGLSIFILETLAILGYLISKVDPNVSLTIILITVIVILNLFAFILIIVGIIEKDKIEVEGNY